MLRRVWSWLLPALVPLALLLVLPQANADDARVRFLERGPDAGAAVANRPLHHRHGQVTVGATQWTDDGDDPDRTARAGAAVTWAAVTPSARPTPASDLAGGTHSVCAGFPRGPPSA